MVTDDDGAGAGGGAERGGAGAGKADPGPGDAGRLEGGANAPDGPNAGKAGSGQDGASGGRLGVPGREAAGGARERTARLAAQLRSNLQRRKRQARARRAGDADARPDGLDGAGNEPEGDEPVA